MYTLKSVIISIIHNFFYKLNFHHFHPLVYIPKDFLHEENTFPQLPK